MSKSTFGCVPCCQIAPTQVAYFFSGYKRSLFSSKFQTQKRNEKEHQKIKPQQEDDFKPQRGRNDPESRWATHQLV